MARRYRQRARAAAATATRERIVAAGREVLAAGGDRPLRLGEVAECAGVARSTIYAALGGTGGLVAAVAEDALARGGFEDLRRGLALPDPHAAMREVLTAGLRLWAGQRSLVRGMYALAQVDPEVAAVVADLDRGQQAVFDTLAARLRNPLAAPLLAVLGCFDTYERLARDFRLSTEQIIRLLVTAAESTLREPR